MKRHDMTSRCFDLSGIPHMKTLAQLADEEAKNVCEDISNRMADISLEEELGLMVEEFMKSTEFEQSLNQSVSDELPMDPKLMLNTRNIASDAAGLTASGSDLMSSRANKAASFDSTDCNAQNNLGTSKDSKGSVSTAEKTHCQTPTTPTKGVTGMPKYAATKDVSKSESSCTDQQPETAKIDTEPDCGNSTNSDLSPERIKELCSSQVSNEDALLDSLGDEYMARRQIRLHNLEQRFKYPVRMIRTMMKSARVSENVKQSTQWLRDLQLRFGTMTFSTAFSGIDTPNIAFLMLCAGIDEIMSEQGHHDLTKPPKNLWACEISNACRCEMNDSVNPPHCIFDNIQDFWQDILKHKISNIREQNLVERVLVPLILSDEAMKRSAFCHNCGKVHEAEEADFHIAGTVCTAFSKKGNHQMLDDVTVLDLLAWVAHRRLIQEPILGQENVDDFPSNQFLQWLGDLYDVQVVVLDPADFGWGIRRRRKYHLFRHKYKAGPASCPLHLFVNIFITEEEKQLAKKKSKSQLPDWDMFFVAPPQDLTDELDWAASRPSVIDKPTLNWKDMTPGGCFELCLNKFETEQLISYREAFPLQCYQLNQSFDQQATRSTNAFLSTIIKNAGIIWSLGIRLLIFFRLYCLGSYIP